MSDEREWVLLCEAMNMGEVQMLRATLEAHGCPCQIRGENTYSTLGPLHGAAVRAQVFVPRGALTTARELAEDIVGPFDAMVRNDDDEPGSPYRREPEMGVAGSAPATPSHKSYAVLVLGMCLVIPPLLGATHLYARRAKRAWGLALFSVLGLALGSTELLTLVWVADVLGGALSIRAHNAKTDALLEARALEEEEEDEDEDEASDPDVQDEVGPGGDRVVDENEAPFWKLLRRLRTA
ncbi:MAG: DUF2007 domain-containing protein [Nannocystaceae bacterium]|nr:DUF2007 domain-containing protein [Nannocystaceae bacterium]